MPKKPVPPAEAPDESNAGRSRRMTLSEIVEHLLNKGPTDHSSVTLSRNAKGETQIEVVVRTGDSGEVQTADEAASKARTLYDELRAAYPTTIAAPGSLSS